MSKPCGKFTVSAGLVGACLTGVGLLNVARHSTGVSIFADDLIVIDAAVLLMACFLAYLALRAKDKRRWLRLERYADALFLLGLSGMVVIGALIAHELIG